MTKRRRQARSSNRPGKDQGAASTHNKINDETRKQADAALRAAEAAKVQAALAKRESESVKGELALNRIALRELMRHSRPRKETPRRFLFLVLGTLICASLVSISASLIPPAFSAPPNYVDPGVVGLFVWTNALNEKQSTVLQKPGISLSVQVSQRDSRVQYVASFPKELVGDRFVIGIAGSAVLDDVESGEVKVDIERPACRTDDVTSPARPERCQLITGIIPDRSDERAFGCGTDGDDNITVAFSGRAGLTSSFDWAHHLTSLPYLGNVRGSGVGSVQDLVEGAFGPNFPDAFLTTCYHLGLNPKWTEYTPNFAPTTHLGDTMDWDPASNLAGYVVVSTERGAQWKGNALLAVVGVFGPAFLSLSVLAVRAGRSLMAQPRRRRYRPKNRR
jgi:hypothetical protein